MLAAAVVFRVAGDRKSNPNFKLAQAKSRTLLAGRAKRSREAAQLLTGPPHSSTGSMLVEGPACAQEVLNKCLLWS